MKFPHHEVVLKIMQNCPKIGKLAFFSNLSRLLWTPIHEMETAHFVSCKIFQAAAFICPGQAAADSSRTTISFKTVHLCRHRVTLGGEWTENAAAPRKNPLEKKGRLLLQWVHIMSLLWQLCAALCPWEIHSLSSKTVTSPKIAVNKGRAWRDFVPQLEHLPYMNCCFILCQHMADLNPFFS